MPRIFISYSRTDEPFARRLAESLSEMGADIWIDVEDIPAGYKWSRAIQEGLDSARLLIVIISPDSMSSSNVEDEWQYYLDNDKPVIPVLLHPSRIHFQLNRIQYIDFHTLPFDEALHRLHAELARNGVHLSLPPAPQAPEPPPPAPPPHQPTTAAPTVTGMSRPQVPPVQSQAPRPRPRPEPESRRSPMLLIGLGGVVVIVLIVFIVLALASDGNGETATLTEVGQQVTDTDSPTQQVQPTHTTAIEPTATTETVETIPPGLPGGAPIVFNQDWDVVERTIEGVPMVLVPAGTFIMGVDETRYNNLLSLCAPFLGDSSCRDQLNDAQGIFSITFERPFWIDKTEVTNAIYSSGDNLPRVNISPQDAQAHCVARGGRLPTEAEWEYAAAGPSAWVYPWGTSWDGQPRANICDANCASSWRDANYDDGYTELAPVGTYPDGASWVGALDMSGNVWEWTSTIYAGYSYPYDANDGREDWSNPTSRRVLRGGAWTWVAADSAAVARASHIGDQPLQSYYGFRCVRDYTDGDLDS